MNVGRLGATPVFRRTLHISALRRLIINKLNDAEYLRRVKTFPPVPAGFDPRVAGDDELVTRGFPRRPDPKTEPKLNALWERAFSRKWTWVTPPKLEIDERLTALHRARPRRPRGVFSPGGWGGAIGFPPAYGFNEKAVMVYAEWNVPQMQPDTTHPGQNGTVGFWVGLDGAASGENDVLQAGTQATVEGTNISYSAWYEWYPGPVVTLIPPQAPSFPINPNDDVTFLVCAPSPGQGFASLMNKTTGLATSVPIPPPSNVTEGGGQAEWIVEAEEGVAAFLPNFGAVAFKNCTASTQSGRIMDLSKIFVTNIAGSNQNDTQTFIDQPSTVLVCWLASG